MYLPGNLKAQIDNVVSGRYKKDITLYYCNYEY